MNQSFQVATPPTAQPVRLPYHLLGRTHRYRWWRPLLALALSAVLGTVVLVLFVGAGMGLALLAGVELTDAGFGDPLWNLASAIATIAILLPVVQLAVLWAERRRPGTLSSVMGRLRWRWMLECAKWAALAMVFVTVCGLSAGIPWNPQLWPGWPTFLWTAAICLVLVPFQAAAEEYVCRGWLLQLFASWMRTPWPGALLTSLLFVGLHEYTDPYVLVDLLIFGMAMSWVTVRTGGLEAAIALHVVNNLSAFVGEALQGVPTLDQSGQYTLWEVVPTTVATLAYVWWIDRRSRQLGIATTSAPLPQP